LKRYIVGVDITEQEDDMGKKDFVEECWTLHGIWLPWRLWIWEEKYVSSGSAGGVDFDWEKAWDDRFLVGWRHTHPGVGFDWPSSIDDRTMRSWVKAFGRPLVCGVSCGDSTRYYLYSRCSGLEPVEMAWSRGMVGLLLSKMKEDRD